MPSHCTRARLLALAVAALGVVPSAAFAMAISPGDGTPDASPHTQLSVFGVRPAAIRSVSLVGTATGRHSGRLRRYSGNRGASFVPTQPFAEGEDVRATVRLEGGRTLRSTFTIAHDAPAPPVLNLSQRQESKLQSFVSEPDLAPPKITVLEHGAAGGGSIFLTPLPSPVVHPGSTTAITIKPVGPGGPMIIDGAGRLVWFKQLDPPDVAADLQVERYRGRRVLTWWEGSVNVAAAGLGEAVIADRAYRTIKRVRAGNGYAMDIHELVLTPEGDALFPVYALVRVHLPGTPEGTLTTLLDSIVQQVDVATGLVVWEWHSLGNIPLEHSYATAENSAYYDAYHINSIQPLANGRVLVSARNTSALYEIDQRSGRIRWTLGGKASDFALGRGARFWFQHHAQLRPDGTVSMFDDQAGPPQQAPSSRGLVLRLDRRRMRATVAREWHRGEPTSAQSEGSLQFLPSGDAFVGWGAEPFISQFSPSGKLVFEARLPEDDGSYRVYRHPWKAAPRSRPAAVATRTESGTVRIAASWNGATEVRRWEVLGRTGPGRLERLVLAARSGFETLVDVPSADAYVVRALDARGRVLGTARTVRVASVNAPRLRLPGGIDRRDAPGTPRAK